MEIDGPKKTMMRAPYKAKKAVDKDGTEDDKSRVVSREHDRCFGNQRAIRIAFTDS